MSIRKEVSFKQDIFNALPNVFPEEPKAYKHVLRLPESGSKLIRPNSHRSFDESFFNNASTKDRSRSGSTKLSACQLQETLLRLMAQVKGRKFEEQSYSHKGE